ncbi:MAG: PQQ-binding-like beta-propeller repeat protein [Tepidisphaerales bacterium]
MKCAGHQTRVGLLRLALGAAAVLGLAPGAQGQIAQVVQAVAAVDTEEAPQQNKNQGFSVPKEDQKHVESLEDFSRYASKKQWELAFKAIAAPAEADLKGMVPGKDGFYVPVTMRIKMLLAGLPPEAKQAYRLFHDAKAKQLLDQTLNPEPGQAVDEVTELRKIVDRYFITSVGDQAADILGDLYFERGDFVAAARTWESILANYPESGISKLKLHVKKAVALARAGKMDGFGVELGIVKDQFPAQTVTVAGKDMSPTEFLASLERSLATTRPADEKEAEQLALPDADAARWQMQFIDPDLQENMRTALMNMGWQGQMMGQFTGTVPPSATDGQRVYVNWLGVGFALDAQTGKLLWRTDKFTDLSQNFQQLVNYMVDVDRYSLTLIDDLVIINRVPPGQANRGVFFQLSCHEAATGKVKWSSLSGPLSNWSFVGQPLLLGQTMYMAGHRQNNAEMRLAAIEAKTGKLEWEMLLGTPQTGPNYRGEPQMPQPSLMYHEGMLYVLTNNGAMLAVNLPGRKLEWAFTYEMPPQTNMNMWWGWRPAQGKVKDSTGLAVIRGGVMYLKEAGGSVLHAIDLGGPSLKWKRPVGANDMIAQIDDRFMYFIGEDVSAMDMKSRDLKWSTRLPQQCTVRPLMSGNHLFVALGRGIYEFDTGNGDTVKIFRGADREALGGVLYQAKDKLICVSNLAVTAYPMKAAGTASVRGNPGNDARNSAASALTGGLYRWPTPPVRAPAALARRGPIDE